MAAQPLNSGGHSCGPAARRGVVLILVLWLLFFLGALAVAAGVYAAAQVELARRMGGRTVAYFVARAGVEQAKAVVNADSNLWDCLTEPWAGNWADFSDVPCGAGSFRVWHISGGDRGAVSTNIGLVDEQRDMDLNQAPRAVVAALFREIGGVDPGAADSIAQAVEARRSGSPDQGPPAGHAERGWQDIHQLLSVQGVTPDVFARVRWFVTVCGDARVNVNTAEYPTLMCVAAAANETAAWQTRDTLARRIVGFREAGHVFTNRSGYAIVGPLNDWEKLTAEETLLLGQMVPNLGVSSHCFAGTVTATLQEAPAVWRQISFIWDRDTRIIRSWHED